MVRKAVIFGTPLVLGLLEIGHPAVLPGSYIYGMLVPIAVWWTALHVLQLPLFALLGVAAYLLVRDLDDRAARVSCYAIAVFIVVYPAFDATVGIGSGIVVQAPHGLAAPRLSIEPALQALFWGPVTGTMALLGSASWLVAIAAAVWAYRRSAVPRYGLVALALSGVLLAVGHIRPLGPLACLCFLIGAAAIELRQSQLTPREAARAH